jgi:hypothetical protein
MLFNFKYLFATIILCYATYQLESSLWTLDFGRNKTHEIWIGHVPQRFTLNLIRIEKFRKDMACCINNM